jgi:hypothetical protein
MRRTPSALRCATTSLAVVATGNRNTRSTPSNADERAPGRARSPRTVSVPSGNAAARLRVSARTGSPAAISRCSTKRPTLPVAPVTKVVT